MIFLNQTKKKETTHQQSVDFGNFGPKNATERNFWGSQSFRTVEYLSQFERQYHRVMAYLSLNIPAVDLNNGYQQLFVEYD